MKCWTLYRQIVAHNGTRTSVPLKVYGASEDAESARKETQEEYAALFGPGSDTQFKIKGRPIDVRLPDFLIELGIASVQHTIVEHEVDGSKIIQPRAGSIILPGMQ